MDPNNNKNNQNKNNKPNRYLRGILTTIAWALVFVVGFNYISAYTGNTSNKSTSYEVKYSEFITMVENDQVADVEFKDNTVYATPVDGYVYTDKDGKEHKQEEKSQITLYTTQLADDELLPLLNAHHVDYTSPYKAKMSPVLEFMVAYILPTILMVGAFMLLMRFLSKSGGGIGGIGNVGKSNAKLYMEKSTGVTFKDVAGQDEAKESLEEIIDFLHNPQKYTAIGAKLPKGALLVGSPGTGKTLLAKAVAGEANVPFFSISGSDFVEMYVGVGASRVRDLFDQAKKNSPSIVFIDEMDVNINSVYFNKLISYFTNPFFIIFSRVVINIACDHPSPITHAGSMVSLFTCSGNKPCSLLPIIAKLKHSLALFFIPALLS